MPSKGGKKEPGATPIAAVVGEAVAADPAPTPPPAAQPTDDVSAGGPAAEKAIPTQLEPLTQQLPQQPGAEEVVGALNHLVGQDAVTKEQFDQIYLHHLGSLGATQEDADQHWAALQAKLAADREEAAQLAAAMEAQAKSPTGLAPWNPLADSAEAQLVEQQRQVFNETVGNLEQTGGHHTAAHLKDLVVKNLSKKGGVSYSEANDLVAAWAGTSSDSQIRSIAMQEAAAEKFGLQMPSFIAKQAAHFQETSSGEYGKLKGQAHAVLGSMYETTQQWFAARGITEIAVCRGMHGSIGSEKGTLQTVKGSAAPVEVKVHLNPLNSWSMRPQTAEQFGGPDGYMLTAKVPVDRVVGSCFTGVGCLREQEFVVLGGANVTVAAAAKSNVSYSHLGKGPWKGR